MRRPAVFTVLRVMIGLIFTVSGYLKLLESPHDLLSVILAYKIVGTSIAWPLAVSLPWVEFIGGVFLIAGLWTRQAAAVLWGLNMMFLVAVSSALVRHIGLKDCGCFGQKEMSFTLPQVLTLDVFLWVACFLTFMRAAEAKVFGLDSFYDKMKFPRRST